MGSQKFCKFSVFSLEFYQSSFFSQQIRTISETKYMLPFFSRILIDHQRQQQSQIQKYRYFWARFWSKLSIFIFFFSNFRHRQRQQWSQIRSYRRNQEEIKAERRFQLHQELKSTVRQRRERALQDFIRVNLRWVNTPPRPSEISEKKWSTQAKPFLTSHL